MNKEELDSAIQKLTDARKYGKAIAAKLKTNDGGTQFRKVGYGEAAEKVGEKYGVTIAGPTARHMVTFAERYTENHFNKLIAECRQHKHCLSFDVIVRLLSISKTEIRNKLQSRAIEGRWTKLRLGQEMRLLSATDSYAGRDPKTQLDHRKRGRKPTAVRDIESLLGELQDDSIKWRRIWQELKKQLEAGNEESAAAAMGKELPRDICKLVGLLEQIAQYGVVEVRESDRPTISSMQKLLQGLPVSERST